MVAKLFLFLAAARLEKRERRQDMSKEKEKNAARYDELMKVIKDIDKEKAIVLRPLVEDIVFIEERMQELRKLPQIRVSSTNKAIQKATPASKQYKELMQSYLNAVKVLMNAIYRSGGDDDGNELLEVLAGFSL